MAARLSPHQGRSGGLPITSENETSGSERSKQKRDDDYDTESSEESTPMETESDEEPARKQGHRSNSKGKTGQEPKPKKPL